MMTIDPRDVPVAQFHGYLLGAVAPRPIAFASTVDREGRVNLSPFSFFNAFSANPPILVFSPARRVRNNTTKHTLENVQEHPEVVISIVSYDITQQMSYSSSDFEKGVNEFVKAGLTAVPSEKVQPPRVGESPASFECKVREVIQLGTEGGAGNLIVCEVVLAHIKEEILDENGRIDPFKLDAVGRMGGNWYARAQGDALFEVAKPIGKPGIGIDQFDPGIRNSHVLTGNDLGKLANVLSLPGSDEVKAFSSHSSLGSLTGMARGSEAYTVELHTIARAFLDNEDVQSAWLTLLQQH